MCVQLVQEQEKRRKLSLDEKTRELSEAETQVYTKTEKRTKGSTETESTAVKQGPYTPTLKPKVIVNISLQMQEVTALISALDHDDCTV